MAVAHAKYMSKTGNKYLDCRQYITDHLEDMLHQVETCYSNKSSKSCSIEDISEKKIQGDMIIANRELYLDSEFQHLHQVIDKKNISIRIDLIKVIHNEIVFVELKRISDNRLLCTDKGATPEIINQMEMYSSFIGEHKEELLKYYILLYNIKKELGLPIPNLDIDKLTINTIPELLIINTYVKESARRSNRIKNLKQLLDKNHIKYSIKSI